MPRKVSAENKHVLSNLELDFNDLPKPVIRDCYYSKGRDVPAARTELQKHAARIRPTVEERREKLRQLYSELEKMTDEEERKAQRKKIDDQVIAWNDTNATCYDLHGMSCQGALDYAKQIVADAKARNEKAEIIIESGCGNLSQDNFPVFKKALMKHFKKNRVVYSVSLPRNAGRIVLTFF